MRAVREVEEYNLFTPKGSCRASTKTKQTLRQSQREATREALGKLSAECEALRDNLKAAAARNAEQEQSIDLIKQELADLKVNTDKKERSHGEIGERE